MNDHKHVGGEKVLAVLLALGCVFLYAGEGVRGESSDALMPEQRTLLAPGPFTNLYYQSRMVSKDNARFLQERAWILNDNIRFLREEILNVEKTRSLEDVPGQVWRKARLLQDIVVTHDDVYFRSQHIEGDDQGEKRVIEEAKKAVASKFGEEVINGKDVIASVRPPEVWAFVGKRSSPACVALLRDMMGGRTLTLDEGYIVKDVHTNIEHGKFTHSIIDSTTGKNVVQEIQFDPLSHLKLHERRTEGDRLTLISEWRQEVSVDPGQFQTIKTEASRPFGPMHETRITGYGLVFESSNRGPFKIKAVMPNSPAATANVKPGDILTAISEKNTEGVNMETLLGILRGSVGNEIALSFRDASTGKTKRVTLRAVEFSYPAFSP